MRRVERHQRMKTVVGCDHYVPHPFRPGHCKNCFLPHAPREASSPAHDLAIEDVSVLGRAGSHGSAGATNEKPEAGNGRHALPAAGGALLASSADVAKRPNPLRAAKDDMVRENTVSAIPTGRRAVKSMVIAKAKAWTTEAALPPTGAPSRVRHLASQLQLSPAKSSVHVPRPVANDGVVDEAHAGALKKASLRRAGRACATRPVVRESDSTAGPTGDSAPRRSNREISFGADGLVHSLEETETSSRLAPAVPAASSVTQLMPHTFSWGRRTKAPPAFACSFDGWKQHPMALADHKTYTLSLQLPAGSHSYKFMVDGAPAKLK